MGDRRTWTSTLSSIIEKILDRHLDYFIKWIEAKHLAKIIERNTNNFVWKNIVRRFGIPKVIISNNAKQFDNDGFKLFC